MIRRSEVRILVGTFSIHSPGPFAILLCVFSELKSFKNVGKVQSSSGDIDVAEKPHDKYFYPK